MRRSRLRKRWSPPSRAPLAQASRRQTENTSVRPARKIFSAISLGVFCRSAPSTRAIMRSRKDSPGLAVMRTTMRSDNTFVPPVTAERSPAAFANHRGGLAGDRRFIHRSNAFDDVAIARDDLSRLNDNDVTFAQRRSRNPFLAFPIHQSARRRFLDASCVRVAA